MLDVLVAPTAERRPLTLAQLAADTALDKATLIRLLAPLLQTALVERNAEGLYSLGIRTVTYGHAYLAGVDLRAAAHPILEQLSAESGETTHLVVLDDPYVTYIDKVEAPANVRMHSRIGARMPLYCTAVGKAMLTWLPRETRSRLLEQPMPPRTANTRTTAEAVLADCEVISRRGWSVDDVENEPEIRCVAAGIFDHNSTIMGACSLSGPVQRVTSERTNELGEMVLQAAADISRRLGAPEDYLERSTAIGADELADR